MGEQIKSPIGAGWSLPFNFVNREDIFMMCVIESFHSTLWKILFKLMMTFRGNAYKIADITSSKIC